MKNLVIILLFLLISFVGVSQQRYPVGFPTQNNTGYNIWGYTRSDSGLIVANRDTNWLAKFSGTVVFKPSDRKFYYFDSTSLRWLTLVTDTTSLSNRINLKLNISDTSSMLSPYLREIDTTNKWVTSVYRKTASDSVFYVKGGVSVFAFIDSVGASGSGLTSVGLSMPSAFTVTNSPLTSNGSISVSGAGTALQYIRGNGTLATFDTSAIPTFSVKVRGLFSGTSPIVYSNGAISILNATASGQKGAATFNNSDFSDNGSGTISLSSLVSAGSCTGCTLNIGADGRITSYSTGAGGATNNTNIGSGFRPVNEGTQEMRTYFGGFGTRIDSVTNTNGLTWSSDTTRATGLPTYWYIDSANAGGLSKVGNGLIIDGDSTLWGGEFTRNTTIHGRGKEIVIDTTSRFYLQQYSPGSSSRFGHSLVRSIASGTYGGSALQLYNGVLKADRSADSLNVSAQFSGDRFYMVNGTPIAQASNIEMVSSYLKLRPRDSLIIRATPAADADSALGIVASSVPGERKVVIYPKGGGGSTDLFYYNIVDYGAVGDGTTDNTNAINAAITAAAATKGVVFIPPGTYMVRACYVDTAVVYRPKGIILKSNVTIMGAGPEKSIIKLSDPPANATFSIIDPNVPSYTTNAAFWSVITGDSVFNVVLKDFSVDGNRANQINIGTNPYQTPQAGWPDTTMTSGIYFVEGSDNTISNVRVDSVAAYGVEFFNSTNGKVTNNSIITTSMNGGVFFWNFADGGVVQNSLITNNDCDNIRIKSSNISIIDNEISWSKVNPLSPMLANFAGLYVEGNPIDITGVKVLGNYFHDNSSFGVDFWSAGDTSNSTYPGASVLVSGNTISYNSNGGMEVAIPNITITNNLIFNNGANSLDVQDDNFYRPYGINLTYTSSTTKGVLIEGNTFRDTRGFQTYALGNGPDTDFATQLTFSNNTVSGGTGIFEPGVIDDDVATIVGNTYRQGVTQIPTASFMSDLTINATTADGVRIRGTDAPLLAFNTGASDVASIGIATSNGQFISEARPNDMAIMNNGNRILIAAGTDSAEVRITRRHTQFRDTLSLINQNGTNRSTRITPIDFGLDNLSGIMVSPNSGTNVSTFIGLAPRGTGFVTTNRAGFNLFNTDPIADPVNYEIASFRAAGTQYVIGTGASGSSTTRPLMLAAGWMSDGSTNANQILLNTNGSLRFGDYGAGSNTGTAAYHLAVNSSGDLIEVSPASATTIYNGDGILSAHRTIDGDFKRLLFDTLFSFRINSSTFIHSNAQRTRAYTAEVRNGTDSAWLFAYTPQTGIFPSFSKGVAISVDTSNNVGLGGTTISSSQPLFGDGDGGVAINGLLSVAGNFYKTRNVTGTTTANITDYILSIDATAGNIDITLPAASSVFGGSVGIQYIFKRVDNSGNTVTITRAGSDTIDGGTSFALAAQWDKTVLHCSSASTWIIISQ